MKFAFQVESIGLVAVSIIILIMQQQTLKVVCDKNPIVVCINRLRLRNAVLKILHLPFVKYCILAIRQSYAHAFIIFLTQKVVIQTYCHTDAHVYKLV